MSLGPIAVSFDIAMASLSSVMFNRLLYSSLFEEVKLSLIFSCFFFLFFFFFFLFFVLFFFFFVCFFFFFFFF